MHDQENTPADLVLTEIENTGGRIHDINIEPIGPQTNLVIAESVSVASGTSRLTVNVILPGKSTPNKYLFELSKMEARIAFEALVDLQREQIKKHK
jgi:hypothetical protein